MSKDSKGIKESNDNKDSSISKNTKETLFPHEEVREIQSDLINEIKNCLNAGKSIIAHAPTGLGKTAAALAPALAYAIKNKKVIFFLTSRHTQHNIALETLKKMKEKHDVDFSVCDIIGKKHMCIQPGVETLYNNEFIEYCKNLRENAKCEFYNSTYEKPNKLSADGIKAYNDLLVKGISTTQEVIERCNKCIRPLCPYEISQHIASQAKVIIADYYYIFNPDIQGPFLKKINKELNDLIIIVDEAHNLPDRMRELMTFRLTVKMLDRAISEAKKYKYNETQNVLQKLKEVLFDLASELHQEQQERLITKDAFMDSVKEINEYEKIIDDLIFIGDEIRRDQKRSYIGSIAEFLERWKGDDFGYVRYIKKDFDDNTVLCYRCLDPSLYTSDIVNNVHSVIMMSGTLTPTSMYRDLLGFEEDNAVEKEYASPFPKTNRLTMIVPETSTKYTVRNEEQFVRIGEIVADMANAIKGNVAIFFPSYYLRDQVAKHLKKKYERTLFTEQQKMTTEEKNEMIERFKSYKETGAALLAVASGSYGEGIDLPGDLLKGVIVVGLPLQKPNLETNQLIQYYDHKFKKGWDYGYLFPAFNKVLQNAGRCIRSKTDKGVIIFLDERYAWSNYYRCFPKDMPIKVTKEYKVEIVEFFWKNS